MKCVISLLAAPCVGGKLKSQARAGQDIELTIGSQQGNWKVERRHMPPPTRCIARFCFRAGVRSSIEARIGWAVSQTRRSLSTHHSISCELFLMLQTGNRQALTRTRKSTSSNLRQEQGFVPPRAIRCEASFPKGRDSFSRPWTRASRSPSPRLLPLLRRFAIHRPSKDKGTAVDTCRCDLRTGFQTARRFRDQSG